MPKHTVNRSLWTHVLFSQAFLFWIFFQETCAVLLEQCLQCVESKFSNNTIDGATGNMTVGFTPLYPPSSSVLSSLGLVIDGRTLAYALEPTLEDKFLALAKRCRSVLCCRSTPLQKSMVVKLVRDKLKAMTLAIGKYLSLNLTALMYTVSWKFWFFWHAVGPSQLPHNWNSLPVLSENMLDNSDIFILTYLLKARIELWLSIWDFFLQKLGNQDPFMLRGFDMSEHSCEELGYLMMCKTPFCNHCITPKKIVLIAVSSDHG